MSDLRLDLQPTPFDPFAAWCSEPGAWAEEDGPISNYFDSDEDATSSQDLQRVHSTTESDADDDEDAGGPPESPPTMAPSSPMAVERVAVSRKCAIPSCAAVYMCCVFFSKAVPLRTLRFLLQDSAFPSTAWLSLRQCNSAGIRAGQQDDLRVDRAGDQARAAGQSEVELPLASLAVLAAPPPRFQRLRRVRVGRREDGAAV